MITAEGFNVSAVIFLLFFPTDSQIRADCVTVLLKYFMVP